ncbi:MAG: hypothetical protein CMJ74_05685 [Planctomycetaceae bacterium]|nr:hypothetical protein [Planctomycetaceae bacterium]
MKQITLLYQNVIENDPHHQSGFPDPAAVSYKLDRTASSTWRRLMRCFDQHRLDRQARSFLTNPKLVNWTLPTIASDPTPVRILIPRPNTPRQNYQMNGKEGLAR